MTSYEITAYPWDIGIEVDKHYFFLSQGIQDAKENCEKFMCEANARELYSMKCTFELFAKDLQDWYDMWKAKGFEK